MTSTTERVSPPCILIPAGCPLPGCEGDLDVEQFPCGESLPQPMCEDHAEDLQDEHRAHCRDCRLDPRSDPLFD